MDFKGYALVLVVVMTVLCAGCMESVDYQPPNAVGMGAGNGSSAVGAGIGNGTNVTALINGTLPSNANSSLNNSSLNNSNMNLTPSDLLNLNGTNLSNVTIPSNITTPSNVTGNETAVNKTIVYGNAVSQGNGTYMFKVNYQLNISTRAIRVERIWPTSILIYVAGQNVTEERKQIGIGVDERIFGLNITLVDIFYDDFAEGRMVYVKIV